MKVAIIVHGKDDPKIVHELSKALAERRANIVDIEQNVFHNVFFMFLVAEAENERVFEIKDLEEKLGVSIDFKIIEKICEEKKENYVVTVLGRDRVGIVRDVTSIFMDYKVKIKKTSLTARGDLIAIEFVVSYDGDFEELKRRLKKEAEKLKLDIVIQPYEVYRKEKRLVVFDMDSTLVDAEIIDEIAKEAGVYDEVKELTEKAVKGEIDFKRALIERVKLLKGLPVEVLERIYSKVKLTEGARELIKALKDSGYKVAVVSGSFSYFTNKLKEELELDYAFANELEIVDGKITGKIKGEIIDAEEKAKIIEEIAKLEGIKPENIVAVGDGANDVLMIEKAGLGIAFNAKEILKEVSDGNLSKENLIGLASVLKIHSEFKKRI